MCHGKVDCQESVFLSILVRGEDLVRKTHTVFPWDNPLVGP